MVDREGRDLGNLRQMAVFATISGSRDDQLAQIRGDRRHG